MIVLAVETATEACSAALFLDGTVIECYRVAPREHNLLILPMIEEVLAEAGVSLQQLDALAFGRGPGSFTGVRIAAGVVQGIGFAADLPVVPVSTLAALALEALDQATDAQWTFPCIDARMGEVYCAIYRQGEAGRPVLEGIEQVVSPTALYDCSFPATCGIGIGSGWASYHDAIRAAAGDRVNDVLVNRFPRAGCVARLGACGLVQGEAVAATRALPVYLRDQVAQKSRVKGRGPNSC